MGAYVFHSVVKTTETHTYVKDWGSWKTGDVSHDVWRIHFTAASPGGEGSIGFAYKLNPSLSLGITGRLTLIAKIKDTYEYTDYYKTDWDPVEPQLMTVEHGEEYGGIGWGMGVSLIF
jgi:hypothetical protein